MAIGHCSLRHQAFSRIAQHSAMPTQSALGLVLRVFAYLRGCKELCISINQDAPDRNIQDIMTSQDTPNEWRFYSDSDHAGNREVQNKRRSQNGFIALYNGAVVDWYSKAPSVAFVSADIGEAHAGVSSAAVGSICYWQCYIPHDGHVVLRWRDLEGTPNGQAFHLRSG